MRIKVSQPDFAHGFLKHMDILTSDEEIEGEEWKRGQNEDIATLRRTGELEYHLAELPTPLYNSQFFANISGETYTAEILLNARYGGTFNKISPLLVDAFKFTGLIFEPTSPHGSGQLLSKNGVPQIGISSDSKKTRSIGLGCNGARPRRFPDCQEFVQEISDLENVANTFLMVCMQLLLRMKKIAEIPKTTYYLNP